MCPPFLINMHFFQIYLAVDFASSRHASEIVQQRREEGVLSTVHVWFCRSDTIQTGRLTSMWHVEDTVCWGTVGRLMWDGGHSVGDWRRGRSQGGLLSLIRLCECRRGRVLGSQHSSAVNWQTRRHKNINCLRSLSTLSLIVTPNNEAASPREVTGSGGQRLHDFGGMGASHPGDKGRSTLLCHLMFIARSKQGE